MPLRKNQRSAVLNGWIVVHESKKLVKPSPRSLRNQATFTRDDILIQPSNDWHDFLYSTEKSIAVPTSDEGLFKSLSLALSEFCEMRDGSVHLLLSKTVLKHQQQIVHTFEAICHKISLDGGRPNMCSWSHRRSVNLDQILTWE